MRVVGIALLVAGVLSVSAPARAKVDPVCIANANAARVDCQEQCLSDFQAQSFVCRGISPGCGVACLAGRQECIANVRAILQTGVLPDGSELDPVHCPSGTNGCDAVLVKAKAQCFAPNCPSGQTCTSCQPNDTTCQDCVDQAQIANFTCHDACRDAYRANQTVKSEKKGCDNGFTACVHACPKLQ
ncbi:MAG: hypothetical protein ACHQ9S_23020 [Candidatus Binatia bacterium]